MNIALSFVNYLLPILCGELQLEYDGILLRLPLHKSSVWRQTLKVDFTIVDMFF